MVGVDRVAIAARLDQERDHARQRSRACPGSTSTRAHARDRPRGSGSPIQNIARPLSSRRSAATVRGRSLVSPSDGPRAQRVEVARRGFLVLAGAAQRIPCDALELRAAVAIAARVVRRASRGRSSPSSCARREVVDLDIDRRQGLVGVDRWGALERRDQRVAAHRRSDPGSRGRGRARTRRSPRSAATPCAGAASRWCW